jgi:hypothetical protein
LTPENRLVRGIKQGGLVRLFPFMPQTNVHVLTERELAGRWVAVQSDGEGFHLPSGEVLVDFDSELDRLCLRVAAAGQSGLTIFRYQAAPRPRNAPHARN